VALFKPSTGPIRFRAQGLDQARLGRRQQFRERGQVGAAHGADPQHRVHIDTDYVAARRKPQLTLAGEQHLPGFMLLLADQGVLAVGAAPAVGPRFPSGAGQAVFAAGPAVLGPSARLEVPAAEGPNNDMDASR
jgi:hypothetical protein